MNWSKVRLVRKQCWVDQKTSREDVKFSLSRLLCMGIKWWAEAGTRLGGEQGKGLKDGEGRRKTNQKRWQHQVIHDELPSTFPSFFLTESPNTSRPTSWLCTTQSVAGSLQSCFASFMIGTRGMLQATPPPWQRANNGWRFNNNKSSYTHLFVMVDILLTLSYQTSECISFQCLGMVDSTVLWSVVSYVCASMRRGGLNLLLSFSEDERGNDGKRKH